MGASRETEQAKPPIHFLISIFLHNLCSKASLPLYRNAEVFHYVVATFVFVPPGAAVIRFTENSYNAKLLSQDSAVGIETGYGLEDQRVRV
jgi:hypothetical protein